MSRIGKAILWISGLATLAAIYNFDAIAGKWKFDSLCKSEGGSRFLIQIERDHGWQVETNDDLGYQSPFNFGHVDFVRYRDKQGQLFDVHVKSGLTKWSRGYDIAPADLEKKTRYQLTTEQGLLPDDQRIGRTRYVITDLQRGGVAATHTYFSYSWTKPDRVILSAPTSVSCHAGHEVDSFFYKLYEPRVN